MDHRPAWAQFICHTDEDCNYGRCILGHCECESQYYQQPNCSQCIGLFMLPDLNCSCKSPLLSQEALCERCVDSEFLDPFTLCMTCKGKNFNFDDQCNSCVGRFDFATGCENCVTGYKLYQGQCISNSEFRILSIAGMLVPAILSFASGLYLVYRKLFQKGGRV